MQKPLIIKVSLGAQSLLLAYWMALVGCRRTSRPWACIFTDTGGEHGYTYAELPPIRDAVESAGGTWITADGPMGRTEDRALNLTTLRQLWDYQLSAEGPDSYDQPPLWILGGGKTPAGCSRVSKIRRGREAAREWTASIGYNYRHGVEIWIGYAFDEAGRVLSLLGETTRQRLAAQRRTRGGKPARHANPLWEEFRTPLFEAKLDKEATRSVLLKGTGRNPGRSLCKDCPRQTRQMLRDLEPADRPFVERSDEIFRNGGDINLAGQLFIAEERKPVRDLWDTPVPPDSAPSELEGLHPPTRYDDDTPTLGSLSLLQPSDVPLKLLVHEAMERGQLSIERLFCGPDAGCGL